MGGPDFGERLADVILDTPHETYTTSVDGHARDDPDATVPEDLTRPEDATPSKLKDNAIARAKEAEEHRSYQEKKAHLIEEQRFLAEAAAAAAAKPLSKTGEPAAYPWWITQGPWPEEENPILVPSIDLG